MINKKITKTLLLQAGDIKHILNMLQTTLHHDVEVSLTWCNQIDISWFDGEFHENVVLAVFQRRGKTPWETDIKATRKLYVAFMSEGTEGVLKLLEKKNNALRALLWKEVNDEDWES